MSVNSETDHAWAAGIIDGEGCIQIRKSNKRGHQLVVSVGQSGNDSPMIQRLLDLYGGKVYEHRVHTEHRLGNRPHFTWTVISANAGRVLELIQPYSVQKRDQVELGLSYREHGVGIGKYDAAAEYRLRLQEAKR